MTSPPNPSPPTVASDGDLARRVQESGDAAALAELCRRLLPRVRAYARRHARNEHEAMDLTQHVMAVTVSRLQKGELQRPDDVPSFVLGVARNASRELSRAEVRWRERHATGGAEPVDPAPPAALDQERLHDCLQRLAERERSIVLLTFYDQLAARQIADRLGVTDGNVRVIRSRALVRLRSCMGADDLQEAS